MTKTLHKVFYAHAVGINRGITTALTAGGSYLGGRFIEGASTGLSAGAPATWFIGLTAGAIAGFLIGATSLKL